MTGTCITSHVNPTLGSTEVVDERVGLRFRPLFERELPYVRRSLLRLGVAERDIDDLAQEVFVRVHARLSELDPSRSPRPWLFAFAARIASNYRQLRRHQREVFWTSPRDREAASVEDPERAAVRAESKTRILEALAALPAARRAVFILYAIDQTPPTEIARALGIPVDTVYSRLRKARVEFEKAYRSRARGST